MSPTHANAHDHGNPHDQGTGNGEGHAGHGGTTRGYLIGFLLSVILTAAPFWLVMTKPLANAQWLGFLVLAFAAVQIVVHMVYFLHMNPQSEGGWSMLALIFTMVLVVITLAGSLWVMHHLNTNMMPMPATAMSSHGTHLMP